MAVVEQLKGGITPREQVKPDIDVPSLGQLSGVINRERRIWVNKVFENGAFCLGFLGLGGGFGQLSREPLWGGIMLVTGATLMYKSKDINEATADLRIELKRLKSGNG